MNVPGRPTRGPRLIEARGGLLAALVLAAASVVVGCSTAPPTSGPAAPGTQPPVGAPIGTLHTTTVATGFERPTFVTNAGDGSGRLFVLEKPGRIRIVAGGVIAPEPFLDMTALVTSTGNEQGLLGLAFHPDFARNGRFFVAYTARNNDNTVAEYRVGNDPQRADPASGKVLFGVADQYPNHNGGMLAFGPDGTLFISMGDGGGGGDPLGNAQNLGSLLGKLLRIDVDRPAVGTPYGIPADNPFVGRAGARPEIWAYGLRNPWRFSFDAQTHDVWIGDVGQNLFEEIDMVPVAQAGANFGWRTMEATHCFEADTCDQSGLVPPVAEYGRDDGCSVIGGSVYRGRVQAALVGLYVYADYCTGHAWALRPEGTTFVKTALPDLPAYTTSFGTGEDGEIYLTGDQSGTVSHLVTG